MRRVMRLAIVALALPTAALARGIPYTAGTFVDGACPSDIGNRCAPLSLHPLAGVIMGGFHHILVVADLVPFSGCPDHQVGTCSGIGVIQMPNPRPASLILFHGSTSAIANKNGNPSTILADLQPRNGFHGYLPARDTLGRMMSPFSDGPTTVFNATPEPGTLGLLGTGLIGLAVMARRKLKLQA